LITSSARIILIKLDAYLVELVNQPGALVLRERACGDQILHLRTEHFNRADREQQVSWRPTKCGESTVQGWETKTTRRKHIRWRSERESLVNGKLNWKVTIIRPPIAAIRHLRSDDVGRTRRKRHRCGQSFVTPVSYQNTAGTRLYCDRSEKCARTIPKTYLMWGCQTVYQLIFKPKLVH